jgi:ankyrin repeat protein
MRDCRPIAAAVMALAACVAAGPAAEQTVGTSHVRDAAIRGFALVQAAQKQSLTKQFCSGTCHLQVMGAFAYRSMKEHGLPVDEETAKADAAKAFRALEFSFGVETLGLTEPGIGGSFMIAAHTMGLPASAATTGAARAMALLQQSDGDWTSLHVRAPSSYSSFTFTAYGLRSLQLLSHPSQKQDVARRVARASRWLESHTARETEERTFQLLGLSWAGADRNLLTRLGRALAATQRPDGGWNSVDGRESEAYSTGQALVALHDAAGVATSDPVYQRGLAFLVKSQAADGSWHVTTRLPPWVNPPYFESGYPYGRDQFISVAGANWAVMALTRALGPAQPVNELPLSSMKVPVIEPWTETLMFGTVVDIQRLLDGGFDPNSVTSAGGITPLMLVMPDVEKAKLLLDHGAQINARSRDRHYTPLTLAAQYPEGASAVRFMLDHGATPGALAGASSPAGDVTPFFAASASGARDVLAQLRDRPETMSAPGTLTFGLTLTPLTAAAAFDRVDTVRALIAVGADVNGGETPPLAGTALGNQLEIARVLIAAGADVNRAGNFPAPGNTALHLAAYIDHGDSQMVDLLLKAGARADVRDASGLTPLDVAEKTHNVHVIAALRAASASARR